eukprot:TRINITY_DN7576_c0_g1_i2.p1 TRINITY_DN7576_c0_g1~~TRINITY_DN7576_c0_g1_i2.p1  ORF type:complete len:140 (+),score=10.44 TRINITY_DN7576_c0_g1_i2:233-652(+)
MPVENIYPRQFMPPEPSMYNRGYTYFGDLADPAHAQLRSGSSSPPRPPSLPIRKYTRRPSIRGPNYIPPPKKIKKTTKRKKVPKHPGHSQELVFRRFVNPQPVKPLGFYPIERTYSSVDDLVHGRCVENTEYVLTNRDL